VEHIQINEVIGNVKANGSKQLGTVASQFLKANGTVDSNVYLTVTEAMVFNKCRQYK
jgi:hypothetical protein